METATPGLMTSSGPRYFGFVIGGSLDAALVADVITSGWEQNAFNEALSPAGIAFEDVAGTWLKEILGLPESASVGFATGCQGANTVGLAAGRWHVLNEIGWDVGRDGLHGAPKLRVVVGEERHGTIDRAVRLLGLGESAIVAVPALPDGAMDTSVLARCSATATGRRSSARRPGTSTRGPATTSRTSRRPRDRSERGSTWTVPSASGPPPARARGPRGGIELADSWACDGHKWLNVPYDSGYAFCAHPEVHATAMAYTAAYLTGQVAGRELGGGDFVLESSRRARGFATWAALRSLGRSGVAELVERCCDLARRFAAALSEVEGIEIVNDVVLNQVLVRVGDAGLTDRLERAIQDDGTCWMGATTWRGERLLRIAVSNWSTTQADVDLVAETVARLRAALVAGSP